MSRKAQKTQAEILETKNGVLANAASLMGICCSAESRLLGCFDCFLKLSKRCLGFRGNLGCLFVI